MDFKHSCDFDNCHYIKVNNKCYMLGFILNDCGVFPDMIEEIPYTRLPSELQVEWGFITLKDKLRLELKSSNKMYEINHNLKDKNKKELISSIK